MRTKKKSCAHVLTNGQVCNAIPMRDSSFCYWHHKARARRRRYERIGGPTSMEANSGLELPFLEDANAIQVTIQEIMQAILDRRIDNKRAGLLLYSLQLASSNIRNLSPLPSDLQPHIAKMGDDDEEVFNDCIGDDDRDTSCEEDCEDCAEEDCDSRTDKPEDAEANEDGQAKGDEHDASPSLPRKPVQPATLVHGEALFPSSHPQKGVNRSPRLPRALCANALG